MKILGIAHPRSGTGFLAQTLEWLGLNVGHEQNFQNGTVNWLYAVQGEAPPWYPEEGARPDLSDYDLIIYLVRDPLRVIPSTLTEDPESARIRRKYISAQPQQSMIEQAARSYVEWNRICEGQADVRLRVEDYKIWIPLLAREWLPPREVDMARFDVSAKTNSRHTNPTTWAKLAQELESSTYKKLVQIAHEYDYETHDGA